MTASDIADILSGTLIGDGDVYINRLAPLNQPASDSIIYVEKEHSLPDILQSPATAILLPASIPIPTTTKTIIQCHDAKTAFIRLLELFQPQIPLPDGIHPTAHIGKHVSLGERLRVLPYAVISDHVTLGSDTVIHPHCHIGFGCQIGNGTVIHSGARIEWGTILGRNNIIQSGAVIGSEGFGYHDSGGKRLKVPQTGIVRTGDSVEIGANTTIDRATIGETLIGSHTKIDNLVQIAHNCQIGEMCYIASQCGIAGSSRLGDRVTLAGQVGVVDHVVLEDDVVVLAQSAVTHSIKAGQVVLGFPARPVKQAKKILASGARLPHLIRRLNERLGENS
ncbi:MAG: UDP-3-O-(3-hydroxymyristoyl)glucosamine N-acyltransferase [Spirochaetota bacterium]|nr:UDP-3-O-(3-hydroxymyristoyl)glucosamine N-acyltransferase [Spirochaetota bacterium]